MDVTRIEGDGYVLFVNRVKLGTWHFSVRADLPGGREWREGTAFTKGGAVQAAHREGRVLVRAAV